MKNLGFLFVSATLVVLTSACDDKKKDAGPAVASPSGAGEASDGGGAAQKMDKIIGHTPLMDQNFDYASSMIDALIAGDLKIAQQYSSALGGMKVPISGNKAWDTGLGRIPTRSQPVTDAKDLVAAAKLAPTLLTACSQCHTTIAGPKPYPPDDPPVPFDASKMQLKKIVTKKQLSQHQWANDRLFDAIYHPDDVSWAAGAQGWKTALLIHPEDKKKAPKVVKQMVKDIQAMDLASLKDQGARVEAYGQLLAKCSACHSALKVKVRAPSPPEPSSPAK